MTVAPDRPTADTHDVFNQPPPLANYNPYDSDVTLAEGLRREGADWAEVEVRDFAEQTGRAEFIALGFHANRHTPELHTHDRYGHRIDEVEYHPAWHDLMRAGVEAGVHSFAWNESRAGAHVARAAKHYLLDQVEAGVGCPLTMTFAVVPALQAQPEIAEEWIPRVTSRQYDPRLIPAPEKAGALMGMAMTEKQGGSDVRANTTRAEPLGAIGPGQEYHLTGHKWFCSAPMCDAFLTLAQTESGLSCFIVPRFLPDGSRNVFRIQRLKDKLGNRSNASSEIEYNGTWARMVGDEGRGVPTIIEMVNHTRLDCVIGSAAIMRQAVAQAAHHAAHRSAFGKVLSEQPLMQNVIADLALESEAATATMVRLARGYDDARANEQARTFVRIATAITKYWICKRCPAMVYEALESHGGAGYVEESIMPRLYREAPLSSIWEGSGNVMCLDVLRALQREPDALPAFRAELETARGGDIRYDVFLDDLDRELLNPNNVETRARRIVERLALAFQTSVLLKGAPDFIAEAFCATRLYTDRGHEFGTLPPSIDQKRIMQRATPQV